MNKFGLVVTAIAAITCSSAAFSDIGTLSNAKITQLITTETTYGGCMARLSKSITEVVNNCAPGWVTFSCDGSLGNSVPRASAMWESAQLAYALDKKVRVRIDNSKKLNGYCYSDYIRVEN